MVTFPVISSGDPSHVSAAMLSFFRDILSAWCLTHSSTMSCLSRFSPAPVSISMGVSCLSIPSLIQALFLVSLMFAWCLEGIVGIVVLHEHIFSMSSIVVS